MGNLDLKSLAAKSRKAEERWDEDRDRRDAARKAKLTVQQFMNHNGPLFTAFARAGVPVTEVVEGEVLRQPASQAMRLATLLAAKVADKPPTEITAAETRPFRTAAAAYISSRWLAGMDVDVERASSEMASAARLADGSWDHDLYRDEGISDHASLMITAVNAATTLARAVEKYDFRAGRAAVMGRLVPAVVEAASRTAQDMLGKGATDADLRNVTQTAARNFASILEACYERKAREVVGRLTGRSEQEKRAWYAENNPLNEVLAAFREWTVCFGGFAVAATRDMSTIRQPDPREGARTDERIPPAAE